MIGFFEDAGLTVPAALLAATQASDGSAPAQDRVFYLGAQDAGVVYRAESDPGVDPVVVSIADAAAGSGIAATAVRLATSLSGLASATPGAALTLPATIAGGTAGAVAVWVRIDAPALAEGAHDDLSLTTNDLLEVVA